MSTDQNNIEITVFAKTNFRNQDRRFGIKIDDRRRHMYLIGKTGMGKTTVLENMIIADIRSGRGLAVVDPHGDLVEKVINFIPSYRINDVVYMNPGDLEYPIGFNVLESVDITQRHLVASGLMGVFTKIWEGVWSARMEYILNNCILALLEYPGSTMLGIARILVDKGFRRKVIEKITDPVVKSFWKDEYAAYNDKFRNEAIAPIQNKVGQFLSSALIRNIVGQPKSTIDLRNLMDTEKIVLLNLAKGRIGEASSSLLGAMMITRLQLAAMSRVDIPEEERKDFFLYVDEFQNFATESFAGILSEARKYRLDLILAHQYIEQLSEEVRAAVFGNVGTIMCFRVGAADAEFLAKEFFPTFAEEDLLNLTKYNVYMKLMIDGVASEPFSASTLPPLAGLTNNRDKVIDVSRERYGKPRAIVEEKILRWSGVDEVFRATAEEENESFHQIEPIYREGSKRPQQRPFQERFDRPRPDRRPQRRQAPPTEVIRDVRPVEVNTEPAISLREALTRTPTSIHQKKPTPPQQNQQKTYQQPPQYPQHHLNPGEIAHPLPPNSSSH
ncbi:MAG: hypothetical protein A2898_04130 [Candidatus Kerfeldbacteria bacterium RIFCSPLOWO2_01_FULL_48_11]|uniref:Type IV secretion system coupling protein TraD DNA-binding domain-containing protein n=1 Tax=Candidatus Kerfeldbacteria bacterium RIFCSPLOWO2_01_FULL_48_11 TaxID=1798543 RepID=A0A1G2B3E8_9BACT|nr:MAG: hypothetical protein UY34_C0001G0030 [Parcubacteria group bacterium GW2011_GWA2_48_9]KKW16334.1 MAG: hypothetical protein UY52_C0006G0015 [Parcubacteria group bacterium GW2011_GWC2_49_9]OGY82757.1 MAG: hypothetical protein A2898_04130 [Candidatus Kerfeldbacteria bacterium RIFCSPLOWO2_01_FULL_48_11]HCM67902.1 hypothetical protein [Candidatus Kerfeldbacteria bacterium]